MWKTCNVTEGSTVAVFGLGAVGLACIQVRGEKGGGRREGRKIEGRRTTEALVEPGVCLSCFHS